MTDRSNSSGVNDWLTALCALNQSVTDCVLVNVIQTRGSAPREPGAKMLVTTGDCVGTIGGGHLEFKAIEQARKLLTDDRCASQQICRYPLGASLGQCCGGVVVLLFERIAGAATQWIDVLVRLRKRNIPAIITSRLGQEDEASSAYVEHKVIVTESSCYGTFGIDSLDNQVVAHAREFLLTPVLLTGPVKTQVTRNVLYDPINHADFHVVLFGAGHIARAMVDVLQNVHCNITWIDNRENIFPDAPPPNVAIVHTDAPELEVEQAPSGSYLLIMTHCHQLDLVLCHRALQRSDISFCGLIGSASKRKRFDKRLLARGLSTEALNRLTCPIGIEDITGKHPYQIAISVSAQLLQRAES